MIGRFSPIQASAMTRDCLLQAEIAMILDMQPCQAPDKLHFLLCLSCLELHGQFSAAFLVETTLQMLSPWLTTTRIATNNEMLLDDFLPFRSGILALCQVLGPSAGLCSREASIMSTIDRSR
jgi:hypothetical protein